MLWNRKGRCRIFSEKYLHHTELLIGDGQYTNISFRRQKPFNSFNMDIRIFSARAMPDINGKLKHGETVRHDILPESGGNLPVFLFDDRKIEKNQYPQNSVFV